jgi:hypothetical protein
VCARVIGKRRPVRRVIECPENVFGERNPLNLCSVFKSDKLAMHERIRVGGRSAYTEIRLHDEADDVVDAPFARNLIGRGSMTKHKSERDMVS